MKLNEAKKKFINSWGALGTHWGINRTMAQIHALLLVSPDPLSQDDIMEQLSISRGNVNMNVRDLVSWGLVERKIISGERKEHFVADKDIWKVATQIIKERKKRELDPMLKLLTQLEILDEDKKNKDVKQFKEMIGEIQQLGNQADKILETLIKAESNWLGSHLLKLIK
ncbi:MAG: MarR family transcriptional regulator [Niastella sp.]|nr:MarR family transcriptional regulator [Niastella sp.]